LIGKLFKPQQAAEDAAETAKETAKQAQKTAVIQAAEIQRQTIHQISITKQEVLDTQQTTQFNAQQTAQTAAFQAAQTAQLAAKSTTAGAEAAATIAANSLQAHSDIGLAAATAFEQAIVSIPFPANIAAAPGIAAGVLTQGEPFAIAASAREGFDVPGDGIVTRLHAKEMVLPAYLAESVRAMSSRAGGALNESAGSVARGSLGSESSAENSYENVGNSNVNLHYHAGNVSALDGTGVDSVLSKHPQVLKKMISGLVRTGKLGNFDPRRLR